MFGKNTMVMLMLMVSIEIYLYVFTITITMLDNHGTTVPCNHGMLWIA